MRKQYMSAPLPFVGQKRMFAKEFIKVLGQFRIRPCSWICSAAADCCRT